MWIPASKRVGENAATAFLETGFRHGLLTSNCLGRHSGRACTLGQLGTGEPGPMGAIGFHRAILRSSVCHAFVDSTAKLVGLDAADFPGVPTAEMRHA